MSGPPTEIIVRHVIEYRPPPSYSPPPPPVIGAAMFGPPAPRYAPEGGTKWWDLIKGIALIVFLVWLFA